MQFALRSLPLRSSELPPWLCSAVTVGLVLALVPQARADLRDPGAWEVRAARTAVVDLVFWEGQLAGAVQGGGILLFDPVNDRLELLDTTHGLSSLRVQALTVGDDGRLWAGTADAGIMRIEPSGVVRAITGLQQQIDVRAIAVDDDFAYFGGPQGGGSLVAGLAEQSFTVDTGLPGNNVQAVATASGRAWFGTDRGVGRFDRALNEVSTVNAGLFDLDVTALYADADQVVLGTRSGLFRLDASIPDAPVWVEFSPPLAVWVSDISHGSGGWAVLAPDNVVHTLADGASAWATDAPAATDLRSFAVAHDAAGAVWVGGSRLDPTRITSDPTAHLRSLDGRSSPPTRSLFGFNVRALAVADDGGVWVGGFPVQDGLTHWRTDESLVVYALRESGTGSGEGDGWLSGTKNAIVIDDSDDLWVSTFTAGVTRLRPASSGEAEAASYFHLMPDSSPLRSNRVRGLAIDPKGRIWFGSSGESVSGDVNVGIDILLDRDAPLDPASWLKITPQNSLLAGNAIWSLDFEGDDVVWITVENFGLQRWDYDGVLETGNIEPAAMNLAVAWDLITSLPEPLGTSIDRPRDSAVGHDGRIWLATDGSGLFGFRYDSFLIGSSAVQRYHTTRPGVPFMSDRLRAVEIDANGGIWTAGWVGLQRVVESGASPIVDAWTDVAGFLLNDLGSRFLPAILSPLAGSDLFRLAFDPARNLMYVGSTSGLSRLRLDAEDSGTGRGFDVILRPNPIRAAEAFYVDSFEGEADVEIYTLAGVLVHSTRGVRAGELVWDTRNLTNQRVVSGLYLVRVVRGGDVVLKTLAVER